MNPMLLKTINETVSNKITPGIICGIIKNNETSITTLGYKSLVPNKIKLVDNDIFDIASLTKVVVTTTAILKLIDDKELTLDTRVKSILPNFFDDKTTIFDLLTHISGLPADIPNKAEINKENLITNIMNIRPIQNNQEVIYSDIGFIILGFIIEKITGNFETFIDNNIFKPLKMINTSYNPKNKSLCVPTELNKKRGLIQGVVHDSKAYLLDGVSGSAGVFSTCNDLLNFCKMYLNDGYFNNNQILSKNIIQSLNKNYTLKMNLSRSLGWNLFNDNPNYLYHTGFTGPSILIDYKRKQAIVLLTNRIHPSRDNEKYLKKRIEILNEFIN